MGSHIEHTLEYFPYICFIILGLVLLLLEIRTFRETLRDKPLADPGRGGFVPPAGKGYEYYASNTNIVYIFQKSNQLFRVYPVSCTTLPALPMKHDAHGQYFNVQCGDAATAEKIIDSVFSAGA